MVLTEGASALQRKGTLVSVGDEGRLRVGDKTRMLLSREGMTQPKDEECVLSKGQCCTREITGDTSAQSRCARDAETARGTA